MPRATQQSGKTRSNRRLYLDENGILRACSLHDTAEQTEEGTWVHEATGPDGQPRTFRIARNNIYEYRKRLVNRSLRRPRPTGEDFVLPPTPNRLPPKYPPLTGKAPTPFNADAFRKGLESHTNRDFANFIVAGLRDGIDTFTTVIGNGKVVRNLPSGFQFPEKITEFLQKEEAAGRYFRIPSKGLIPNKGVRPDLHFSPLGTAPKRSYEEGVVKRRVISHHSAGPHRQGKDGSVNGHIHMRHLAVEFQNVLDVMDAVRDFGAQCRMSKTDIRSAYRNLPIKPELQHTQCSEWDGVLRADLCLSFGTASGPWSFEQYACAVHYILQRDLDGQLGKNEVRIFHYLDDCILVGRNRTMSDRGFDIMKSTYRRLGIPLSEEKTEASAPQAEFLGLVIDAANQCLCYPDDKNEDLVRGLRKIARAGKSNRGTLRSLLGKLGFAHAGFPFGRPFVTELYRLANKLKVDAHFVRLSGTAHADIANWIRILTDKRGNPFLNRDWVESRRKAVEDGSWACGDASGETGYGWFTPRTITIVHWEPHERASFKTGDFANSSTWQETTALVAAALSWIEEGHRGECFVYFSDAENLRHNFLAGRSSNSAVNGLLRLLAVQLIEVECRLEVVWQPRTHTMQKAADCLSRDDPIGCREILGPGMHRQIKPLSEGCKQCMHSVDFGFKKKYTLTRL